MFAYPLSSIMKNGEHQEHLFAALEAVLAEVVTWQRTRICIRSQIVSDFRLPSPTEEQVHLLLQDFHLFADALRWVAAQLEAEIEETTDQYHEWLCD